MFAMLLEHGRLSDVRVLMRLSFLLLTLRSLGLLRACELLDPEHLVQMLKAVKHLSMSPTLLEVLQNANAIEILVKILEEQSSGPYSTVCASYGIPTQLTIPDFI